MSDDARPIWPHKISEDAVRWLSEGYVTKITHHWEMTGVDTARDWIMFHTKTSTRIFPTNFLNDGLFEFKPNWRELVVPNYQGEQAIKDLAAIDDWEAKHKRDRSEYERLKRKFES